MPFLSPRMWFFSFAPFVRTWPRDGREKAVRCPQMPQGIFAFWEKKATRRPRDGREDGLGFGCGVPATCPQEGHANIGKKAARWPQGWPQGWPQQGRKQIFRMVAGWPQDGSRMAASKFTAFQNHGSRKAAQWYQFQHSISLWL